MSIIVTSGAQLMCSFGMAPSALNVLPAGKVLCSNMPAACTWQIRRWQPQPQQLSEY